MSNVKRSCWESPLNDGGALKAKVTHVNTTLAEGEGGAGSGTEVTSIYSWSVHGADHWVQYSHPRLTKDLTITMIGYKKRKIITTTIQIVGYKRKNTTLGYKRKKNTTIIQGLSYQRNTKYTTYKPRTKLSRSTNFTT